MSNSSIWPIDRIQSSARVDLGAMAMEGYFEFPEAPALLMRHHQIICVSYGTCIDGAGVLPHFRDEVDVFYCLRWLGFKLFCIKNS